MKFGKQRIIYVRVYEQKKNKFFKKNGKKNKKKKLVNWFTSEQS